MIDNPSKRLSPSAWFALRSVTASTTSRSRCPSQASHRWGLMNARSRRRVVSLLVSSYKRLRLAKMPSNGLVVVVCLPLRVN